VRLILLLIFVITFFFHVSHLLVRTRLARLGFATTRFLTFSLALSTAFLIIVALVFSRVFILNVSILVALCIRTLIHDPVNKVKQLSLHWRRKLININSNHASDGDLDSKRISYEDKLYF